MKRGCVEVLVLLLSFLTDRGCGGEGGKDKVEYVRLPLLTFVERPSSSTSSSSSLQPSTPEGYDTTLPTSTVSESSIPVLNEDGDEEVANWSDFGELRTVGNVIDQLTHLVTGDDDGGSVEEPEEINLGKDEQVDVDTGDEENGTGSGNAADKLEEEEEEEDKFNELDLIELVQELERQADEEEQTGIFPELLEILHGKFQKDNGSSPTTTSTAKSFSEAELEKEAHPEMANNLTRRSGTARISLNEEGDLELGSDDLSDFSDEIVDGIFAGVEESLRMSDDLEIDDTFNFTSGGNDTAETRQFSVYLFQGQYYAEPRLNRFIDGALRNMGTELRVSSMDPLFFRVLPRGHVAERERPLMPASGAGGGGMRRRRPAAVVRRNANGGGGAVATGRQLKLPAFFRPNAKKRKPNQQLRQQLLNKAPQRNKLVAGQQQVIRLTNVGGKNIFLRRKRQQQRQRRRRQRIRQQKLNQQLKNRRKKLQQQQNNKNKNNINKQLLQRIRRRIKQDVGGGRIEGLSRVQRDGDAEMQLFGNYTLIRSHMRLGPVEITMQFRTKNGIRRSGATLPVIRAHTVTRLNHEGSELIDYLLDRPTPEMIRVRGTLFPMAQRVARNIFARLFLPNSFLVTKLRQKASLAFLSKPVARRRRKR